MEYNLHITVKLLRIFKIALCQVLVACLFVGATYAKMVKAPNNTQNTLNKESKIVVKGIVTDRKGEPLVGVSVKVKGTDVGISTDINGQYTLNAEGDVTLVFTYIGYATQEVKVNNRTSVNVKLNMDNTSLNEVVVVGYGTQKKVTVTGSVATVKGTDLEKSPSVNLSNSLAGRLAGVTAVQASGEPGADGSKIRIRGTNSLGNSDALIVIDGVPDRAGGLERINPADVESVSILKDAAAAIYGSRAGNGVILITTKRGKSGKTTVSYDYSQGYSQPTRTPKMSNSTEFATINNELVLYKEIPADQWAAGSAAFRQTGHYQLANTTKTINASYQPSDMQKYADGSDPLRNPNTDWYSSTLKNWSPQSKHTLQINGGNENVRFLSSAGYSNQDGYYKNSATGYKQYDMRLNLDAKVNKYINTAVGLTAREESRFYPTQSANDVFRMLMRGKPTEVAVWPNGLPGPDIENGQNPVTITTNETGYARDKRDYFQLNGKFDFSIPGVEGLKFTGSAAVDKLIQRNKTWQTPWSLYYWQDKTKFEADGVSPLLTKTVRSTFTDPRLGQSDENKLNILLNGFVNYDRTLGNHTVNLMAAVSKETINSDNFNAFRRNFISPAVDQLFAGGDLAQNIGGGAYERARLSYFGRAAYNYKQKYLAEFLWRYDGSYAFPEDSRFGFFPGVLAGWNISEENFFKNNVKFINRLKLRGSWGQMGAEPYIGGNLAEYQFLSTYGFGTYIINDQVTKTLYETKVPNPNFTWEVANNANVALEGDLFNSKINFEFEYFNNKRSQILWQKQGSTPESTGIKSLLPPENIGKVSNKGWEFKVGYNGQANEFKYNFSVNGGYSKNKIVYQDEVLGAPEYQLETGHRIGAPLVYLYDGVFKDQAEINALTGTTPDKLNYTALTPNLRPGDMKYKDYNGDHIIDGKDRVRLDKNRDPNFTGGFSMNFQYKGFDLSGLFQGATGGLLGIGTESGDIGNFLKYSYDNRWTVENPSSVNPRLANRNDQWYSGGNDYFIRKSDYLRLKNLEIGYNLSPKLGKRAGISNLRVYVNGLNLITWDKMKIWDPESTNGDGQYYPQARIISTGARVTF